MKPIILASLVNGSLAGPIFFSSSSDGDSAPLVNSLSSMSVTNSYIIKFKDHVDEETLSAHHQKFFEEDQSSLNMKRSQKVFSITDSDDEMSTKGVKHHYNMNLFKGYSGKFTPDVLDLIRKDPQVEFIEPDSIVRASDDNPNQFLATQSNAPWGLARISTRNVLTVGSFKNYLYDSRGGEGVTAYVIDTGINTQHVDFEGRARWGKTIPVNDRDSDQNGHGSHVAGTIAGKQYGVAKKANVVAVKVLRRDGSGLMSDVLKGVEYATNQHIQAQQAAKNSNKKFKGSTANMSLGGGLSRSLDSAVNAAVDAGITFAVAAGNDNADACNYSPAAAEKAVTVGSSTIDDQRSSFSNRGKCVNIFAPGSNIKSIWIGSSTATNTISGTSMASPHVCGLLTYFLSLQPAVSSGFYLPPSPVKLKQLLLSLSTSGKLKLNDFQTDNKLAYNNGGSSDVIIS